jgi:hypothetical protein
VRRTEPLAKASAEVGRRIGCAPRLNDKTLPPMCGANSARQSSKASNKRVTNQ